MSEKGSRLVKDLAQRRSVYHIGPNLPISQSDCTNLICDAVRQCPSGFNAEGARILVLYGDEHKKLWELLRAAFGRVDMPPEAREKSIHKLETSFLAGAGTVLFFQDGDVVAGLQKNLPLYKDAFPKFAQHEHGIVVYAVWCVLAAAGIGANLQHYTDLIGHAVHETFDIPRNWRMIAQMPFGETLAPAEGEVKRRPDSELFRVLGKL